MSIDASHLPAMAEAEGEAQRFTIGAPDALGLGGDRYSMPPASNPQRPGESVFFSSLDVHRSVLQPECLDDPRARGPESFLFDELLAVHFALDEATGYCLGISVELVPYIGGYSAVLALALSGKDTYAAAIGAHSDWRGACVPEKVSVERGDEVSAVFKRHLAALGCDLRHGGPAPSTQTFMRTLTATLSSVGRASMPTSSIARGGEPSTDEILPWGIAERQVAVRRVVDVYHATPQLALGGLTPSQAWERGCRMFGTRPLPAPEPLARLFGQEIQVRALPRGLTLGGLTYSSPELSAYVSPSIFLPVRVRMNPFDMGSVSVLLNGQWSTVPCTDPAMIGVAAYEICCDIVRCGD